MPIKPTGLRTVLAGVVTAVVVAAAPAAAQQAIRLGTSSVGSSFYVIAVAMSKVIQEYARINVSVEPLGGSHANVFGIERGKVDFAITNSGAAFDGYHGVAPFKKKVDIRLVIQGQPTLRWFLVRKGAGIKTPADLVGKTIASKRKPLPELDMMTQALIKLYGLPGNKIKQVATVNLGEVNRILRAGSVDAVAQPFSLRQPVTAKLFADGIVEPLIIPEDKFDRLKAMLPDKFSKFRVKANNFENQPQPFWVLKMTTLLTTSARTPEETVYRLTKAVMAHHEEFVKYHASARAWTVKNTMTDPKVPFHPGAVRYYKEVGAWNAEMDRIQERLLKAQ